MSCVLHVNASCIGHTKEDQQMPISFIHLYGFHEISLYSFPSVVSCYVTTYMCFTLLASCPSYLLQEQPRTVDEDHGALGSHGPTPHPWETVTSQGRWYRHGRNISHQVVQIPSHIDRDTQPRREKPLEHPTHSETPWPTNITVI